MHKFYEAKCIPVYICLFAVLLSAFYVLLIYPEIAGPLQNEITTDGYDRLGCGLYRYGTLSYYPSRQPTVMRGPVYPLFVAGLLAVKDSYFPRTVQLAQSVLHGLTCLLVFGISKILWDRRRAVVASLLCSVHPYLIWFTSRVVVETVSVFLFTAIVFSLVYFYQRPTFWKLVLVGGAIGIGSLCKQTFLPFVFLLPLLLILSFNHKKKLRYSLGIVAVSVTFILPWTLRNYLLTKKFVVVHAMVGFNLHVGDSFVENYGKSPFGYAKLIDLIQYPRGTNGELITHGWLQSVEAKRGLEEDRRLVMEALRRYVNEPVFLLKKIGVNGIMFWTLSSTPFASVITTLMQVPLLFFFTISALAIMKKWGAFSVVSIPIWLVVSYFLLHLPIYAVARFGVVLVPTMIAYGVYLLDVE